MRLLHPPRLTCLLGLLDVLLLLARLCLPILDGAVALIEPGLLRCIHLRLLLGAFGRLGVVRRLDCRVICRRLLGGSLMG